MQHIFSGLTYAWVAGSAPDWCARSAPARGPDKPPTVPALAHSAGCTAHHGPLRCISGRSIARFNLRSSSSSRIHRTFRALLSSAFNFDAECFSIIAIWRSASKNCLCQYSRQNASSPCPSMATIAFISWRLNTRVLLRHVTRYFFVFIVLA